MSESNVQINFTGDVEFPQPEVEALTDGVKYWLVGSNGAVWYALWHNEEYDRAALAALGVYKTRELAEQRAAWNAQKMRRLVIPAWFRALGPDVEMFVNQERWELLPGDLGGCYVADWSKVDPKNYRSKPRDVVVTVNGKEYRWPATVKAGDPAGPRFRLSFDTGVYSSSDSTVFGDVVHHTRAGAESQLAAIREAAGVVAS